MFTVTICQPSGHNTFFTIIGKIGSVESSYRRVVIVYFALVEENGHRKLVVILTDDTKHIDLAHEQTIQPFGMDDKMSLSSSFPLLCH